MKRNLKCGTVWTAVGIVGMAMTAFAETPKSNPTASDPFYVTEPVAPIGAGTASVSWASETPHFYWTLFDVAFLTDFDSSRRGGLIIFAK